MNGTTASQMRTFAQTGKATSSAARGLLSERKVEMKSNKRNDSLNPSFPNFHKDVRIALGALNGLWRQTNDILNGTNSIESPEREKLCELLADIETRGTWGFIEELRSINTTLNNVAVRQFASRLNLRW